MNFWKVAELRYGIELCVEGPLLFLKKDLVYLPLLNKVTIQKSLIKRDHPEINKLILLIWIRLIITCMLEYKNSRYSNKKLEVVLLASKCNKVFCQQEYKMLLITVLESYFKNEMYQDKKLNMSLRNLSALLSQN